MSEPKVRRYRKDHDKIIVRCPVFGCNKEVKSITYQRDDDKWWISHKDPRRGESPHIINDKDELMQTLLKKWNEKYEKED